MEHACWIGISTVLLYLSNSFFDALSPLWPVLWIYRIADKGILPDMACDYQLVMH